MSPPHVIVIGGPNGAGKSTIAPLVLRDYLAVPDFVNADQIAAGLSAFNPEGAAAFVWLRRGASIIPTSIVQKSRLKQKMPYWKYMRQHNGTASKVNRRPNRSKTSDTAALEKVMQQAVTEAVEKARKLGYLPSPSVQEDTVEYKAD